MAKKGEVHVVQRRTRPGKKDRWGPWEAYDGCCAYGRQQMRDEGDKLRALWAESNTARREYRIVEYGENESAKTNVAGPANLPLTEFEVFLDGFPKSGGFRMEGIFAQGVSMTIDYDLAGKVEKRTYLMTDGIEVTIKGEWPNVEICARRAT